MLRSFHIGLVLRVVGLLASFLITALCLVSFKFYIMSGIWCLIIGLQVFELLRYLQKTNQELAKFILALKHQDFSISFNQKRDGRYFKALNSAFSEIVDHYRQVQIAQDQNLSLLFEVVNRIPVGLIVVDEAGEVRNINDAAKSILGIMVLHKFDDLNQYADGLAQALKQQLETARNKLKIQIKGDEKHLAIERITVKTASTFEVYLIFDIDLQTSSTEMDSWLNLIRIMTHEIVNSITSVSSLASTSLDLAKRENSSTSLQEALAVIANRSAGMLDFVKQYRKLTQIPKPQLGWTNVHQLVKEQLALQAAKLNAQKVVVEMQGAEGEQILMDATLIAQVISNLILNALEAMKATQAPKLRISWLQNKLIISNNGEMIAPETMNEIFIPFFTTKQNGAGIGLSLCRQIMRLHKGKISVSSTEAETAFKLSFE